MEERVMDDNGRFTVIRGASAPTVVSKELLAAQARIEELEAKLAAGQAVVDSLLITVKKLEDAAAAKKPHKHKAKDQ